MSDLLFLKLGGSLLTDKTEKEALRTETLNRLAGEIASARAANPGLQLVLGHGSGSFGHVAAAKYGTRSGVSGWANWFGFAEVSDAAARLNRFVVSALLSAGVPAMGLPPSASAQVVDGRLGYLAVTAIESALAAGLVPVVYGDVAFDTTRGGTIVSTEEVMEYLANVFRPTWLLLAGETSGVLDLDKQVIPQISRANLPDILPALAGSRGTDVTGGMIAKVTAMLDLVESRPGLLVRIFSGMEPSLIYRVLIDPSIEIGTQLS